MSWDTLWYGGTIIQFTEGQYDLIHNGAIACQAGKITWLGAEQDLPDKKEKLATNLISFEDLYVSPSLIDCHTHIIYGGNRAHEFALRLRGESYETIARAGGGIAGTVQATRDTSEGVLYSQALSRVKTLIAQGVGIIEIKSGYGLDLDTELKMLRVARRLGESLPIDVKTSFLGAHTIPIEYNNKADDYINFVCDTVLPIAHEQNLVDAVDVFCESIAFNLEQTEKVLQKAQSLSLPVKIHAEQLTNSGAANLGARYQALSCEHLEYLDEKSAAAMAKNRVTAVLLPGAYYFLQENKKPPIELLRQYNIPMAIATDANPGSSPATSLLLMMNMACVLFNMTPEEAWLGVTSHAAKALGLENTHGSLSINKQADFTIWNIDHPDQLAYGMGNNYCHSVYKQGKLVYGQKRSGSENPRA